MSAPSLPEALRHRYALRGRLGAGGMGEVLAVRDALLGEDVALKLLRADRRESDARLMEEFTVLASLDHPGVVGVREVGIAGDAVYMTTALLEGERLDAYLDGAPPHHVVEGVLEDVLGTLAWLHGHGLVHGDIKPANILVLKETPRPWPVLIDFGLAHRIGAAGGPMGGTPGYMAPELLGRGRKRPSARSDLYALGRCFEPWARDQGERPAALVVTALMARVSDERPEDADAALRALGRPDPGHRLGGRGPLALWGRALEQIGDRVQTGGGHLVELPGAADCRPFARALKTSLEVAGQTVLVVPEDPGAPLDVWKRLLVCLGETADLDLEHLTDSIHAPEGHSEALDAFAIRIVRALRAAGPGCILVPDSRALSGPDRHVLKRCLEGGVDRPLVLFSGPSGGSEDLASDSLERHRVPTPDKRQVRRFLRLHGVDDQPDDAIMTLVAARAQTGAGSLKSLLVFWAESGLLVYDEAGRWRWDPDGDPNDVDAPDLDAVWQHLWSGLGVEDQTVLVDIVTLGGSATAADLVRMNPGAEAIRPSLIRLARSGWTRGGLGGCVSLAPMAATRFDDGRLALPPLEAARRDRALDRLREASGDASPPRQRALAVLLAQTEHQEEASNAWARVADESLARLDTAGAGQANLQSARAALASGRQGLVQSTFSRVERAARLLEVVGDESGLDEAMDLARRIAREDRADETGARVHLLEAHVALHRGRLGEALEHVEKARGRAEKRGEAQTAIGLDIRLIEGSALAGLGRTEEAASALEDAADRAEALGDLHAAGRVSNNLGNVHLRLDQARSAEAAYARSGAIKERTGDARGRRIAQSNRALALRHLGDRAEAARVMANTLELAEGLGDRRGIVTARLVLTLIALDLGQLLWAEEEMAGLEGMETGSAIAQLNVDMAQVRLALARGDETAAADLAERVAERARESGLKGPAREAAGLHALAQLRQPGDGLRSDQLDALVGSTRSLALEEREAGGLGLLPTACGIHALALGGRWEEAREELRTASRQALQGLTPDTAWVLGLLGRAARLLGERQLRDEMAGRAASVMADLQEAWRDLRSTGGGKTQRSTSVGMMKRALGIEDLVGDGPAQNESAAHMDPILQRRNDMMETTRDPAMHALTVAVGGLPEDGFAEPRSWARALRRASGADSVTLVGFAGSRVEVLGSSPEDVEDLDRVAALSEGLRGTSDPFIGKGRDGALEVLGLPLGYGEGSEALGAAMMSWPDGTAEDASGVIGRLIHTGRLAALVVERHGLVTEHSALSRRVQEVTEESVLMVEAHADEVSRLRDALHHTQTEVELRHSYDHIIHRSRAMRRVLRTLDKVTDSDVTVLVLGESGVGKEVLSRALHHNGPRSSGPFVAENCGAVPAELFESVFFGHLRGAFTGANTTHRGLVEQARGGTLFLDEVGELRPEHQVKLLRVLQERRFRPVGGTRELEADFRLVAATNRDLEAMVEAGEFREDLFYRLSVVRVEIPPLRERREDIMPLLSLFLEREAERGGDPRHLSTEAVDLLSAYDWPGNVREMENEMLRASVLAEDHNVEPRHLSPRVRGGERVARRGGAPGGVAWDGQSSLDQVLGVLERQVIEQALAVTRGKKAPTARMLGISRPGLDAKLQRHGIDVARFRATPSGRAVATR